MIYCASLEIVILRKPEKSWNGRQNMLIGLHARLTSQGRWFLPHRPNIVVSGEPFEPIWRAAKVSMGRIIKGGKSVDKSVCGRKRSESKLFSLTLINFHLIFICWGQDRLRIIVVNWFSIFGKKTRFARGVIITRRLTYTCRCSVLRKVFR